MLEGLNSNFIKFLPEAPATESKQKSLARKRKFELAVMYKRLLLGLSAMIMGEGIYD